MVRLTHIFTIFLAYHFLLRLSWFVWKCFFPSFLKDTFIGYKIRGWQSLFPNTLNILLYYSLPSIWGHSGCFLDLVFILGVPNFTILHLTMESSFSLLRICFALIIWRFMTFISFGKFSIIITSNIIVPFSLYYIWRYN